MPKIFHLPAISAVTLFLLPLGCNFSTFQASSAKDEFIDSPDESPLLPGDIQLGEVHAGGPYISFSLFRETAQAVSQEDFETAYATGRQAIDAMRNEGANRNTFTLETMQFDDYMIHAILTAGSDERFYPKEGSLKLISFRFVTNDQEKVGSVEFELERAEGESVSGVLASFAEEPKVKYGEFPADVEYKVLREKIRAIGQEVYLPLAKKKAEEKKSEETEADASSEPMQDDSAE